MLSANKIKFLKSLDIKKYRIKEDKVVLEGTRLIGEALKNNILFDHIWVSDNNQLKPNIKSYPRTTYWIFAALIRNQFFLTIYRRTN